MLLQNLRNRSAVARSEKEVRSFYNCEGADFSCRRVADDSATGLGAILFKIHSECTHATTDNLLDYRVEWDPSFFARVAQKGINPMLNVGLGYDEGFPNEPAASHPRRMGSADNAVMHCHAISNELPLSYGLILSSADGEDVELQSTRKAKPPPDHITNPRT